jgi:hypothetical protein
MESRRLIIGGGLREMERLLDIMSKRSIMDMEPNSSHTAGHQQVEEVPLKEIRGRITSFIGCLEHNGECAACPGCWEYYGDLQYQEDIFDLEEGLEYLDFDSQFSFIELRHRRKAADKLAGKYLGKEGIIGIYAAADGGIKVFVRGDTKKVREMLPKQFMGCSLEIIKSKGFYTQSIAPTAPCGPAEMFDD